MVCEPDGRVMRYVKIVVLVPIEKVDAVVEHLEMSVGDEWYATTFKVTQEDTALIDEGRALRDE